MNPSGTDQGATPVLTEILDAETIDLALVKTAHLYECQNSCKCGRGKEFLSMQKELFERYGIERSNARAFAQGLLVSMGLFGQVPLLINQRSLTFVALCLVESLRLTGDIVDAQVEAACRRFRDQRGCHRLAKAGLERMVGYFGEIATADSRRADH
jgi:hypothetical protein